MVAEFGELFVDSANDLDVVVLDVLEVLLLELLFTLGHLVVDIEVALRAAVLLPLLETEWVLLLIAKTPHHSQKQFKHHQDKHLPSLALEQKAIHVPQAAVKMLCIAELSSQSVLVVPHFLVLGPRIDQS